MRTHHHGMRHRSNRPPWQRARIASHTSHTSHSVTRALTLTGGRRWAVILTCPGRMVVLKNTGCVRGVRGSSMLTATGAGNSATGLGGGDGAGSNGAGSDGAGGDGAGSDGELAEMELDALRRQMV